MERNTIVLKAPVGIPQGYFQTLRLILRQEFAGISQGSLSLALACSIILRRLSKVSPNNAKTHRFVIIYGYTLASAIYIGYQFTCYTEFINLSFD